MRLIHTWFYVIVLLILNFTFALADDPGITKVRLIQLTDTSYLLEADVPQQLIWSIKQPIFPDRFEVSEIEYQDKSGWIVARATATTKGKSLNYDDELLLPWMRNGADLTVQWKDGTFNEALFIRSIDGIHVPISSMLVVEKSEGDIMKEYFISGLKHAFFHGIHILLVLAIVLLMPDFRALKILLWYSFGQGLSMILVDINFPGFELIFVDILGLIIILIMAVRKLSANNLRPFGLILLIFGLLHGLSFNHEIIGVELSNDQILAALFAFSIAIEMIQYSLAFALSMIAKRIDDSTKLRYIPGTFAIFITLSLFNQYVIPGDIDILQTSHQNNATKYSLPASQSSQSAISSSQGARSLSTPIMNYINIEPYEVRQEIPYSSQNCCKTPGH